MSTADSAASDLSKISPRDKAEILSQALPYIRKFHGKTIVIKYGGNAMTDPQLQRAFAEDVVFLRCAGLRPVVVHGGGPQIEAMLKKAGVQSQFAGGLRVTDKATLERVRDEFGVPHAYLDSAELLRDPSVDGVVIVTPTNTHREVAVAAGATTANFTATAGTVASNQTVTVNYGTRDGTAKAGTDY